MRKFPILFAIPLIAAVASAQDKLDIRTQMMVSDYFESVKSQFTPMSVNSVPTVTVLVNLDSKASAADIVLPEGATINDTYGSVLVIELPMDKLEELAENKSIISISASAQQSPMMNKARPAGKVDQVQQGSDGLSHSYDGTGVVVGLVDTGVDPNHVNFMNSDLTASRVKQAYAFNGSNGVPTVSATTPDQVLGFTTDNARESHGTHVAGIMTGSYNGEGEFVDNGKRVTDDIPYYGVATTSDIVMCGASLYDTNILAGVKKVIEYAESQNKPAVVNLSLGSIMGPHDGKSTTSLALAELGERGIICISAGNDADRKCAVDLGAFNLFNSTFYTGLPTFDKNDTNIIELWSDDAEGFDMDFILYSPVESKAVSTFTLENGHKGALSIGGTSTNYTHDDNFTANFTASSSIRMQSQVDPNSKRYYVYIESKLVLSSNGYLIPAVKVYNKVSRTGTVYGYTKEGAFSNNNITAKGWKDGTANGSISDMATGDNVIAIGSFNSATSFAYLASPGTTRSFGQSLNRISSFSSYGPNVATGVQLPVICGPGSLLNSSVNNYCDDYSSDATTTALAYANARSNRWAPMQGTSMSSPFVAGVVALWLQADPTLTCRNVIDIMKSTAIVDSYVKAGPAEQWGAGKIDALEGIKEVIRRKDNAGIDNVVADGTGYVITPAGPRAFNVIVDGAPSLSASICNMQGMTVASVTAAGNELIIEAADVQPGAYILTVQAPNANPVARKIVIR